MNHQKNIEEIDIEKEINSKLEIDIQAIKLENESLKEQIGFSNKFITN